jgi:hypothetical protein
MSIYLVLASRGSGARHELRGDITCVTLGILSLHDGVRNIRADRILITGLTREDSRSIRGVSSESLEGVEVSGRTGLLRIPLVVNRLLGVVGPQDIVELSVNESAGGRWGSYGNGGGNWGRCGSNRGGRCVYWCGSNRGGSYGSRGGSSRGGGGSISLLKVLLERRGGLDGLTGILMLEGIRVTGIEHTSGSLGRSVEYGGCSTESNVGRGESGISGDKSDGTGELHCIKITFELFIFY